MGWQAAALLTSVLLRFGPFPVVLVFDVDGKPLANNLPESITLDANSVTWEHKMYCISTEHKSFWNH